MNRQCEFHGPSAKDSKARNDSEVCYFRPMNQKTSDRTMLMRMLVASGK
jgi:hypothetical protein